MNRIEIFAFSFALLLLAACVPTGITAKQYTVQITDAETGVPISGAVVNLYYFPATPDHPEPGHPQAISNDRGEVNLSSENQMAIWQVQADGYIEQRLTSNDGSLPPRYAAHATGTYDGIIHLYKLPEPQLNILVNDHYTGPLTIQLEPAPGFGWVKIDPINVAFAAVDPQASYIQDSPGTRVFTETASADGVVDLVVTPLLYDIQTQQIVIQDDAGRLPFRELANSQDSGRGVWGTVNEDDKKIHHQIRFFVGTREDYLKYLESKNQSGYTLPGYDFQ